MPEIVTAANSSAKPKFLDQIRSLLRTRHYTWAKLFLKAQIAKGKTHPTAVRALAFKWQRIMFVCWRGRVLYDEATYLAALQHRGSPLASKLSETLQKPPNPI